MTVLESIDDIVGNEPKSERSNDMSASMRLFSDSSQQDNKDLHGMLYDDGYENMTDLMCEE